MFKKELEIAIQASKKAGEIIQNYRKNENFDVEFKSKNNPVTLADKDADQIIKNTILKEFPQDGWLSEETRDDFSRLEKNRVWIVDPLDGTKEFIKNIPEYAVSIALVQNHRPVVGVIYNPGLDEIFWSVKGEGAYKNDHQLTVSDLDQLVQAKILASRSELSRNEWDQYQGKFDIIPAGGMAYKMVAVSDKKADGSFSLTPKSEWDFAAGDLIIHEAGGVVLNSQAQLFQYNQKDPLVDGIFFSNQKIASQLFELSFKKSLN